MTLELQRHVIRGYKTNSGRHACWPRIVPMASSVASVCFRVSDSSSTTVTPLGSLCCTDGGGVGGREDGGVGGLLRLLCKKRNKHLLRGSSRTTMLHYDGFAIHLVYDACSWCTMVPLTYSGVSGELQCLCSTPETL